MSYQLNEHKDDRADGSVDVVRGVVTKQQRDHDVEDA